jgi:hypothetical protein
VNSLSRIPPSLAELPLDGNPLSYWVSTNSCSEPNFLISLLDETTDVLKLYLGLETGAIVLFVKVLTDAHFPTLVLSALAISVFCFGFSALTCLGLILGVISFRGNMVATATSADPNWQQVFDLQLRNWRTEMQKAGTRMEWSFRLAIIFASIFVVGVLVKR